LLTTSLFAALPSPCCGKARLLALSRSLIPIHLFFLHLHLLALLLFIICGPSGPWRDSSCRGCQQFCFCYCLLPRGCPPCLNSFTSSLSHVSQSRCQCHYYNRHTPYCASEDKAVCLHYLSLHYPFFARIYSPPATTPYSVICTEILLKNLLHKP
jgi:hypothetical protein